MIVLTLALHIHTSFSDLETFSRSQNFGEKEKWERGKKVVFPGFKCEWTEHLLLSLPSESLFELVLKSVVLLS